MSLQTKRECPHHSRFILPSLLIALHPLVRSTQRLNQLVGCLSWRVSFQYLVICTSFSVRDSLRGLLRQAEDSLFLVFSFSCLDKMIFLCRLLYRITYTHILSTCTHRDGTDGTVAMVDGYISTTSTALDRYISSCWIFSQTVDLTGFPGSFQQLVVKNTPAIAGDIRDGRLIPGLGRSPGAGCGSSLQYYCLENLIDREACQLQSIRLQRVGHD